MQSDGYEICLRVPLPEELIRLRRVAGLSSYAPEGVARGLAGTIHAVVIEHEGQAVGMGRLIGDGGCAFQIVDIAVDPAHQGRGLGKRIMDGLMRYVTAELPAGVYVSLIADLPANELYAQFGFEEVAPSAVGMAFRVGVNQYRPDGT